MIGSIWNRTREVDRTSNGDVDRTSLGERYRKKLAKHAYDAYDAYDANSIRMIPTRRVFERKRFLGFTRIST